MKPGDLVEFKAGLFGLAPPKNLGIYLERVKRKGNFFVVVLTLKGRQEIKPDNVTGRRLSARVDAGADEGELKDRLKTLVSEFAGGALDEKPRLQPGEINDRVLWNKVWEDGDQSPEEMASRYFETASPAKSQVGAVRNVLATCARPGVGYFERVPGRGEKWHPITADEYKLLKREIEGFNKLRKKLIQVEEIEPENDWDRPRTVYHGVPLAEADLDDDDRRRLGVCREVMAKFVLHDRVPEDVGMAGTPVHTVNDFSLFKFVKWLALDWVGEERASISSQFVEFLLDSGHWTVHEAIVTIAKRKILANGSFEWDTDPSVIRAAERFEGTFEVEGRRDLRGRTCWTIDPPDARDHDDAVGVEFHEDGSTTLWVHIADVSHYVEKDGALDHHAKKRATSVYLPTGVLPMLPERLSNDLCSLKADQDRYAMTAAITYGPAGDVQREEFMESLIRVTGNVSYDDVLAKIEEGNPEDAFVKMEAFARKLDARRRGLPIETGERRVRVTEEGVSHAIKQGNRATKMIEVFMVQANEAVARYLTREGAGCLYRCHPLPDRAGAEKFNQQMETMELPIRIELPEESEGAEAAEDPEDDAGGPSLLEQLKSGGKMQLLSGGFAAAKEPGGSDEDGDGEAEETAPRGPVLKGLAQLSPDEQEAWLQPFRSALTQVEAIPDARVRDVVYLKALGAMGRAIYTPDNLGHYGLGSACYAHFTSPIRRYADLVVHRQLRWLLRGREGEEPHPPEALEDVAGHATDQTIAAESLERGVVDASMVFVSREGGWEGMQDGVVNGLTKGGVFLSLPRGLEARVSTSDIPGGPWSVDEAESMLFVGSADRPELQEEVTAQNWRDLYNEQMGEVVKVRVRLGDRVGVRVSGRDYVDGKVSAKLAE